MIDLTLKYDTLIHMEYIFDDLKIWADKIDNALKKSDIPENSDELISEYIQLSARLLSDKNTPSDVINFLLSEDSRNREITSDKYTPLKKINTLYEFIKKQYKIKIQDALSQNDFSAAAICLSDAVKSDIKNIELFNLITSRFLKNHLYKDLIELYKTMFIYTVNPVYFEKIGDVYLLQEDYNAAIDAYLSCAEGSDDSVELYTKLADVFGKINDNESRSACLEHIKIIEAENGK